MNYLYDFIFGAIVAILLIFALIIHLSLKKEKIAYENMIAITNDMTVAEYIKVFRNTHNNFAVKLYNLMPNSNNTIEDNVRYAQGYSEVANSPNVSPELKEQLKILLLSKGMTI